MNYTFYKILINIGKIIKSENSRSIQAWAVLDRIEASLAISHQSDDWTWDA